MATSTLQLVVTARDEASGPLGRIGGIAQNVLRVGLLAAGAAALALGKGLADAVSGAMDFEQGMNMLQAVSGATADEMAAIQQRAIDLGADLTLPATSAQDAAVAMTELAKAGLSVDDVMGAAKGTLQLAAAGALSEAQAAEIAANALNMFKLEGTEAARVADLLAAAANASSAEVTDVADSLKMAGSVFASAGVSLDDLTAAIGQMANQGIKGSDAGTSLKQMLLSLTAPTDTAKELMEELGISVYDAQGAMVPFRDIIGQFTTTLAGASEEERNFALKTIFGTDAVRAANIVMMGGVDAFDAMGEAVGRQGAAQELAAARTKGLKGALDGLKSQLETVSLKVGMALLPHLTRLVETLGPPLIGALETAVTWFEGLLNGTNETAAVMQTAWATIQNVVATVMPQILAIVTPILEEIREFFLDTWGQVRSIVETVLPIIQNIIQTVLGIISGFVAEHGDEITAFIQRTWASIQEIIALALEVVRNTIVPVFQGIATFLSEHTEEIKTILGGAWQIIQSIVDAAMEVIKGVLFAALLIIQGDWDGAWKVVKLTAENVWKEIQNVISGALTILETTLGGAWERIKGLAASTWDSIKASINSVKDAIQPLIDAFQRLKDFLAGLKLPNPLAGITLPSIPGGGGGALLSDIPVNAGGTSYFGGGLSWVGERGPELVRLPRGSRIYNNADSERMAGNNFTINISAPGGDPQAVATAAQSGIYAALRAAGMA